MNSPTQLDSFETALLTELRREVAEHPAPAPAPGRHPRRRLRLAAAGALATAAATVAAVGLTAGGPTASPAFAVDDNPDGSVDIVVHRLDDAAGLEAALAEHGVDATVHFVPVADGQLPPEPEVDGTYVTYASAASRSCGIDNGPGPATLMPDGESYDGPGHVLQIPAGSPLFERPVVVDVGSPGSFSIAYPSAVTGKFCYFGQSQLFRGERGVQVN